MFHSSNLVKKPVLLYEPVLANRVPTAMRILGERRWGYFCICFPKILMNESLRNPREPLYKNVNMFAPTKIVTPPFCPALACGGKLPDSLSPAFSHPVLSPGSL